MNINHHQSLLDKYLYLQSSSLFLSVNHKIYVALIYSYLPAHICEAQFLVRETRTDAQYDDG
jgi:hypothetical protein